MMNIKCLKETFKTGTIEKVGQTNQSATSEINAQRQLPIEEGLYEDINLERKVESLVRAKTPNIHKVQSRTMGGSLTKEKNLSKKTQFQERESAPPKSVFELFQSREKSGKGLFELTGSQSG